MPRSSIRDVFEKTAIILTVIYIQQQTIYIRTQSIN